MINRSIPYIQKSNQELNKSLHNSNFHIKNLDKSDIGVKYNQPENPISIKKNYDKKVIFSKLPKLKINDIETITSSFTKVQSEMWTLLTSTNRKLPYKIGDDGLCYMRLTINKISELTGRHKNSINKVLLDFEEKELIKRNTLSINKKDRAMWIAINTETIQSFTKKNNVADITSHITKKCRSKNKKVTCKYNKSNSSKEELLKRINHLEKLILNISDKMENTNQQTKRNKIYERDDQKIQNIPIKKVKQPVNSEHFIDGKYKNVHLLEYVKEALGTNVVPKRIEKNLWGKLNSFLKNKCGWDLEKAKRYIDLIKKSTYLMGEKFYLTLGWILKFETFDKITSGMYGLKEHINDFTNGICEKIKAAVEAMKATIPEEGKEIAEKTGEKWYRAYLSRCKIVDKTIYTNGNGYLKDVIDRKLYDLELQNLGYSVTLNEETICEACGIL